MNSNWLYSAEKITFCHILFRTEGLDGNYTRMLRAILNKSWQQHPTRHQLYGHLPPITKTIQVRRTRHAGYCWRSRDELIRDVLLWIPTHGRAKAGRPARTYIQQLCEDTGCCPEDLPWAMNDREEWRERIRDIRAASTIWWWWWWWYIHVCVYVCVCMYIYICSQKLVKSDRMYVEVVKRKKYVWWFVYLPTRFDFNLFLMQRSFIEIIKKLTKIIEIIEVWEIIMLNKFWFNYKSSSRHVDLAMWKNGLILIDTFKLRRVMWWNLWRFIALNIYRKKG